MNILRFLAGALRAVRRFLGADPLDPPRATAMCDEYDAQRLLGTVIEHLQARNMRFGQVEGAPLLFTICGGMQGTYPCVLQVNDKRPVVMFLCCVGCHAPAEKRQVVAELLARINYKLLLGNFEMDFNDGEIRFRTSIDVQGGELSPEMIQTLIDANLYTVERYHPAIMTLLWNDLSPEDAVAMIDGQAGG